MIVLPKIYSRRPNRKTSMLERTRCSHSKQWEAPNINHQPTLFPIHSAGRARLMGLLSSLNETRGPRGSGKTNVHIAGGVHVGSFLRGQALWAGCGSKRYLIAFCSSDSVDRMTAIRPLNRTASCPKKTPREFIAPSTCQAEFSTRDVAWYSEDRPSRSFRRGFLKTYEAVLVASVVRLFRSQAYMIS